MTYAVYARQDEDIVLNSTTIGFGDNSASLLAGVAILPVVFAILPTPEALAVMGRATKA
jgi:neurotransmitter:Na+ symporter, NSS family